LSWASWALQILLRRLGLWGDAVNVASRMESTDEAGKVRLSEAVYRQLEGEFELEARGLIEIKGKGQMPTWFLVGQKALLPRPVD
jgi:adenylate cyclase